MNNAEFVLIVFTNYSRMSGWVELKFILVVMGWVGLGCVDNGPIALSDSYSSNRLLSERLGRLHIKTEYDSESFRQ